MEKDYKVLHDWCIDIEGNNKHISEVKSGKHGYFCPECNKELIAKKGEELAHHFSHDAKDVKNNGKCLYTDETYRHKIAKAILHQLKKIKVKPVFKYPPHGVNGKPNKLRDAEFIYAHTVENELSFYQDTDGIIKWGRNLSFLQNDERDFLIRPDVTFFDIKGKPLLLIELVATHKITTEKIHKIRCLGIDTVEVKVPKGNAKEIEETFLRSNSTEWIYNNEQEHAKYVSVPSRDDENLPSIDEHQKHLLRTGESFACRKAELKNFIRRVEKYLGSEQSSNFKEYIRAQTARTEDNTRRDRKRLRELQEDHRAGIEARVAKQFEGNRGRLEERRRSLEERREKLAKRDREFREHQSEIQRKYDTFKPPCKGEIEELERIIRQRGSDPITLEDGLREIAAEEGAIESRIRAIRSRIEAETEDIKREINTIETEIERCPEKLRNDCEGIRVKFENLGTELRNRFEELRRKSIDAIENRDCRGTSSRIYRGIREIIEGGENIRVIEKKTLDIRRMRKTKEFIASSDFKNAIKNWR